MQDGQPIKIKSWYARGQTPQSEYDEVQSGV